MLACPICGGLEVSVAAVVWTLPNEDGRQDPSTEPFAPAEPLCACAKCGLVSELVTADSNERLDR